MNFSIGNLKVSIGKKEKKNKIKAEYRFTEYGNNYYEWLLV